MAHSKKLLPVPSDKLALKAETEALGLLKPKPKIDTGRKELISSIHDSSMIGRSPLQGSILVVGSSGVGKSSTVNHLFDLAGEGITFAKTSDTMSETRVTTEFVVQADSEKYQVSRLKMGLVNSPGFNDTGGSKQDACNYFSIKRFYEQHPVLKGCYPNLIFLLIDANDVHLLGQNSNLSKTLKCLCKLGLVDKEHPNVIGIMTHAEHLGRNREEWLENFTAKKQHFNDAIFEYLQVPAKLVAIENKTKYLEKKDAWTILPDGITKQPLNLYEACTKLFNQNGDSFGHLLFNSCFLKCSSPTAGFSVEAKDALKEPLSERENEFHDYLLSMIRGLECPLVYEAKEFIRDNKLEGHDAELIQNITSSIMRLGMHDKDSLKTVSLDVLNFFIEGVQDSVAAKTFLLTLGVPDLAPNDTCTRQVLGQGYNLLQDKTLPLEIFKHGSKETNYGLVVPASAKFSKLDQPRLIMDLFDSHKQMVASRMQSLNVSLELDFVAFSTKWRPGYNTSTSSTISESTMMSAHTNEYSFLLEQRMFELKFTDLEGLQLTDDFVCDVEGLPAQFVLTEEEDRMTFKRFFDKWGHFLVIQAYGGGSIELQIPKAALEAEGVAESDVRAEFLERIASCIFLGPVAGAVHNSPTTLETRRIISQSKGNWKGGDQTLLSNDALLDGDTIAKWKISLMKRPVMLEHEMSLLPISEAVKMADVDKSMACQMALEGLLGGRFKLQQEQEEESKKEQREAEKWQAKEEQRRAEEERRQKEEEHQLHMEEERGRLAKERKQLEEDRKEQQAWEQQQQKKLEAQRQQKELQHQERLAQQQQMYEERFRQMEEERRRQDDERRRQQQEEDQLRRQEKVRRRQQQEEDQRRKDQEHKEWIARQQQQIEDRHRQQEEEHRRNMEAEQRRLQEDRRRLEEQQQQPQQQQEARSRQEAVQANPPRGGFFRKLIGGIVQPVVKFFDDACTIM